MPHPDSLHIAVMMDRYLPLVGGAQQVAHQILRGLVGRGHHVTVLTRRVAAELPVSQTIDGVTVFRAGVLGPCFLSKLTSMGGMVRWARRLRDVDVFLNVPVMPFSDLLPTWLAAKMTGKPYVIRTTALGMFDDLLSWGGGGLGDCLRKPVQPPPVWRAALAGARAIVVQSDAVDQRLASYGLSNRVTCWGGVDTNRFVTRSPEEKSRLRRDLSIPGDRLVMMTTGRYARGKNQIVMLQALKELVEGGGGDRIYAVVLGGREQKSHDTTERNLKDFVREHRLGGHVMFREQVPNVEAYLGASDLFIFPSMWDEGLSNALLEAMVCGLPVICGDLPQNRAVLPSDLADFFDPSDAGALAVRIRRYLDCESDLAVRGQAMAGHARPRFALERVVETYEQILGGVARQGLQGHGR